MTGMVFLFPFDNYYLILFIVRNRSKSKWNVNCFISKCLLQNFLSHRVVALWANCPQYPIRITKVKMYDSHLRRDNGILREYDQQSFVVWLCGRELICYHAFLAIVADCCRRLTDSGDKSRRTRSTCMAPKQPFLYHQLALI